MVVRSINKDGETASCVWVFISDKHEDSYDDAFRDLNHYAVLELGIHLTPRNIMCDFEAGLRNALKKNYGLSNGDIQGCFFHLRKNSISQMKKRGVFTLYKRDGRTSTFLKCFDALAFLPEDLVEPGFEALMRANPRPNDNRLANFCKYKEVNYNGDRCVVRRGNIRLRLTNRRAPRFPISSWNQYTRTLLRMARTNNVCEGYHSSLRQLCRQKPNVFMATDFVRREIRRFNKMIRRKEFTPKRATKLQRKRDRKLYKAVTDLRWRRIAGLPLNLREVLEKMAAAMISLKPRRR
ncbi:hypothetical protein ACHWQZ_G017776 [Mnemiopsis leidyi]